MIAKACAVTWAGFQDLKKDLQRIAPEDPGDQHELDQIDTPLSSFIRGHHGLRLPKPPRQFDLRKVRATSSPRQSRADDLMVLGLHPFRGGSHATPPP
jgi:hypothetical protein